MSGKQHTAEQLEEQASQSSAEGSGSEQGEAAEAGERDWSWILWAPDYSPKEEWKAKLEALFHDLRTPKWGKNTVQRLFSETLPAVIKAGGQYR